MVDGIVDAEKAVVGAVERHHLDRAVLRIVLGDIERELLRDSLGVDFCIDVLFAFVEERQHGVVNIVVEQNDTFLGGADEVGNKSMSVEDLTIEEDTLLWGFEQLEHTVDAMVSGYLVLFKGVETLEDARIGYKEVAHSDKGIHNLDAYLNCSIAM